MASRCYGSFARSARSTFNAGARNSFRRPNANANARRHFPNFEQRRSSRSSFFEGTAQNFRRRGAQSMIPLHNAVASAKLVSHLAFSSRNCSGFSLCTFPTPHFIRSVMGLTGGQTLSSEKGVLVGFATGMSDNGIQSVKLQIADALRLGDVSLATNLLKVLGLCTDGLVFDEFLPLLQYCSNRPYSKFLVELCRFIEQKLHIDQKEYYLIIRALIKAGCLDEALHLLKPLGESSQIKLGTAIYNIFLRGCSESQSLFHAEKCLKLMEIHNIGKSEITYTELMKLAVPGKNVAAVYHIWEEYTSFYPPSILSFKRLVQSLCKMKALTEATDALQTMLHFVSNHQKKHNFVKTSCNQLLKMPIPIPVRNDDICATDSEKTSTLAERNITSFEDIAGVGDNNMEKILHGRLSVGKDAAVLANLRKAFNHVICLAASKREDEMVENFLLQMRNIGLKPSVETYNGVLKWMILQNRFYGVKEVMKKMKKKKIKHNDYTRALLVVLYSRVRKIDLAEHMLDEVTGGHAKYRHPFHALFEACRSLNKPERAIKIFAKMRNAGVEPNIRTYEILFSVFGFCNTPFEKSRRKTFKGVLKRLKYIENDMAAHGIGHSERSINYVLRSLGNEGTVKQMLQFFKNVQDQFNGIKFPPLSAYVYNTVLNILVNRLNIKVAFEVFEKMKSLGVKLDATTYNIMIHGCRIEGDLDKARGLMNAMVQDGFNLYQCTYTALLKVLLKRKDYHAAFGLFSEMERQNIQPDVVFYNTLLKKVSKLEHTGIMESILEHMHRLKVEPDPETCRLVFTSYWARHLMDTAVEALQVLSLRMISENEEIRRQTVSTFRQHVLDEDIKFEEVFINVFRKHKEFLALALFYLRFCALYGESIIWEPEESEWAIQVRRQYNETMGLQE